VRCTRDRPESRNDEGWEKGLTREIPLKEEKGGKNSDEAKHKAAWGQLQDKRKRGDHIMVGTKWGEKKRETKGARIQRLDAHARENRQRDL